MRPAAHLEAAIQVLTTLEQGTRGTDRVLRDDLARRRYAGARDRRVIGELVYAALRRRAETRFALGLAENRATPRLEVFADWMARMGADPAALDDLIAAGGIHAPAPATPEEAVSLAALAARRRDARHMPAWARAGVPEWTMPLFVRRFAEGAEAEARALNVPAPVDLRVNLLRAQDGAPRAARAAAIARLAEDGIAASPTPLAPLGLRLDEPQALARSNAYREGLVEIQDEGSQLVAACVTPEAGALVVDYCAGAGGKALAIAAATANGCAVVACDVDPRRLARLAARAGRAGAAIERRALDGTGAPPELAGAADWVLVDAPCSGSGAWRRDPAARWRLSPERLAGLTALQDRILRDAARLVRPGGRLVYATCSLFMEENEDRVASFLRDWPRFRPGPVALPGQASTGPFLFTTPLRQGCDGFFAALLRAAP